MSSEDSTSSSLENQLQQLSISEAVSSISISGEDDKDWLVVKARQPKEKSSRINVSSTAKSGSVQNATQVSGKITANNNKSSNYKAKGKQNSNSIGQKKLEEESPKGTIGSQKGPSTLKYVPPPPPPPSSALSNEDYKADLSADKISALITGLSRHSTDVDATSDYTFSPRGITNNSCACFRNSVIQALLAIDPLMSCILLTTDAVGVKLSDISRASSTDSSSYWIEFLSLLGQFYLPSEAAVNVVKSSRGVASVDASSFIPKVVRTFQESVSSAAIPSSNSGDGGGGKPRNKGRQEDAMEFLTLLLDTLHEEIVAYTSQTLPPAVPDPLDSQNIQDKKDTVQQQQEEEEWNTVSKKKASKVSSVVDDSSRLTAKKLVESSIISRFFHGTLRSEVMYKAKKVNSITFQRFHCLTLDVQGESGRNGKKPSGRVSISTCLDMYFREEVLVENEIHKQLQFEHLPAVLVLQLGRFSFDYSRNIPIKVHTEVEYPAYLDISESFLSADCKTRVHSGGGSGSGSKGVGGCSVRYALSSVILHLGHKATGGHYSAHCRDPRTHTWRNFNDLKVRSLFPGEELASTDTTTQVYIYFKATTISKSIRSVCETNKCIAFYYTLLRSRLLERNNFLRP
eukprot:gene22500-30761_t